MCIFRKMIIPTWVHKMVITRLVINIFSWNIHHWIQHTELSIHAKNSSFYKLSWVVPFLIAGHILSLKCMRMRRNGSVDHNPHCRWNSIVKRLSSTPVVLDYINRWQPTITSPLRSCYTRSIDTREVRVQLVSTMMTFLLHSNRR